MGNTLTDALVTKVVNSFFQTIANDKATQSWQMTTSDVLRDQDAIIQRVDAEGGTVYTGHTPGSEVSATDITMAKSATSAAGFEKRFLISKLEGNNVANLLIEGARKLARDGAWSIANAYWTTFAALDTTAHPEAGGQYDGGAKFTDSFTAPQTQTNQGSTALSAASLDAALTVARTYLDKGGSPFDWAQDGSDLVLVVPPALESTAISLLGRNGEVFDGSGLQAGSFGSRIGGYVCTPKAYDANDWFLVNKAIAPIKMWIRTMPQIQLLTEHTINHYDLVAYSEYTVVLEPYEGGVFQAVVA